MDKERGPERNFISADKIPLRSPGFYYTISRFGMVRIGISIDLT